MGQIIEADYRVVPERTLDVIATEIRIIDAQLCQAIVQGAVEIGRRLKEAKEKVDHGQWETWCESNLNYTASWASKLMRISEEYGDENSAYSRAISNRDTCPDLSISKALRLLRVPEDAVETFVEQHDLATMSVKELEEEIRKLKAEKENFEDRESEYTEQIDHYEEESDKLKSKIEELEKELNEALAPSETETELEGKLQEKETLLREAEHQLEEASQKIRDLKAKAKEEKKKKEEEVENAVKSATEEARRQVEEEQRNAMAEVMAKAEDALKRAVAAEEKLTTAGENARAEARAVATLNIKGELMQESFNGILSAINAIEDPAKQEKLRTGVGQILDTMRSRL